KRTEAMFIAQSVAPFVSNPKRERMQRFPGLRSRVQSPRLPPMSTTLSLPAPLIISCSLIALLFGGHSVLAARSFPDVSQLASLPGLPDPLVLLNGEHVTTTKQWLKNRRPELKALFEHYMYGVMPPAP